MSPSSLHSFMAPINMQCMNMAVGTVLDVEMTLLTEEQQVQQDTDNLVKALKEANHKHEELANKRQDTQAAREKGEAEQCEADMKVRGKLLANVAVAEVWHQVMRQAEKARLVAEKLKMEWQALQLSWKVQMRLGVSFFPFFFRFEAEKSCRLPLHQ